MQLIDPRTDERPVVTVAREGMTLWATLDRPEARNALKPPATFRAFEAIFQLVRDDASVKALVITGAGDNAFCMGSDLSFLEEAFQTRNFSFFRTYLGQINRFLCDLEELPVPTIAMVQGRARAGGFELLLACDFVLIADEAQVGDVHTPFGHMPGGGATQRLARKVGVQRAMDIILTGRWLSSEEAVECGIAIRRAPRVRLREATAEFARQFDDKVRDSLALSKRAMLRGWDLPLRDGIALEVQSYIEYLATSEAPVEQFWKNRARAKASAAQVR
jgi:2-(1,2-epoxy-1,2-dihydrophenyl)acetyl-CoA isomerase/putative hydratase